jgi:ATP-dependent exoDNAse (exonuclease V) beta subunit
MFPSLHELGANGQDTNTTQYELMRCFAEANGGLTVVGDPDQSIYGWRSAEVENLNKMVKGQLTIARNALRYKLKNRFQRGRGNILGGEL